MVTKSNSDSQARSGISRRGFMATAGAIAAANWLGPARLLAEEGGIVEEIKQAAATGEIIVQPLVGNISVILGSGGNIAVLPGADGMLLIDAGIAISQPKVYEPAHTDSDISVHFADADVFHAGDTWWNGIYPFIDYSSGGNIDGTIAAAEANLAKVTDHTIVIPGHGAVGTKAEMIAFRDMLVAVREKVAALKEAGKTLQQTQAAKPTADFDDKWGKFVITPDAFTELVYQGV